jgi:hypothetical protein
MTERIGHQLTGYDRKTQLLAVEYDVEPSRFKKIKKIAGVAADDPDAIGSYPLGRDQLRAISGLTGIVFDNDHYEFFLEPVATAPRARA